MKDELGIDEKCYELARHFLQDLYAGSGDEQHLAADLQKIAEDFCRELEAKNKLAKR